MRRDIDMLNYDLLPKHIRSGMKRYIENKVKPGQFLCAVLSNDLQESFGQADNINLYRMLDIVSFLYNEAPSGCYGSPKKVKDWLEEGAK